MKPVFKEESPYFAALEAGYIGQMLMDKQAEFEIGVCPIGGLKADRLFRYFKLNKN
jgi:polyketide synthase PksN